MTILTGDVCPRCGYAFGVFDRACPRCYGNHPSRSRAETPWIESPASRHAAYLAGWGLLALVVGEIAFRLFVIMFGIN